MSAAACCGSLPSTASRSASRRPWRRPCQGRTIPTQGAPGDLRANARRVRAPMNSTPRSRRNPRIDSGRRERRPDAQEIEMTSAFAPGAPCWFDVTARDISAAAAFYSGVFGWEATDLGAEAGHYTILHQGGVPVAGIAPATAPDGSTAPPVWTVYFRVEDIDAAVATAAEAGERVELAPVDVFGQ